MPSPRPLSPPDTATMLPATDSNGTETIIDCLLAYIVGHVHQLPKDQIKTVVLNQFTKEEILQSKVLLWDKCANLGLDKLVQWLDTNHRPAEDANTENTLCVQLTNSSSSTRFHSSLCVVKTFDVFQNVPQANCWNHPCWRGCRLWKPTLLN